MKRLTGTNLFFGSLAVFTILLTFGTSAVAHFEPRSDVSRYKYEFTKYADIAKFRDLMDEFSDQNGLVFIKQKQSDKPELYFLSLTDDIYEISCSNINFSLVMFCRETHLKSVKLSEIDFARWGFREYVTSNGLESVSI